MDQYFINDQSNIVTSDRILYTASSFARSSLLHLQENGTLTAKKIHTSRRSNLRSFLFFCVLSGAGCLTYGGKSYELNEGSCVFLDCRKPYSHTTDPEKLWTLKWCHFYGPAMDMIYSKYCERGGKAAFKAENLIPYSNVLEKIYIEATGADYIRDMRINQYLSELLVILMSESWNPEEQKLPAKQNQISEVRLYLEKNYMKKITLEELCERFYISKYYLTHCFKEHYGVSIISFLQNLRITKAKQLLRFSDKSIEEIGELCGIGDLHYFSRVFKNVEGISPSAFRVQWRERER